MSPVAKPCPPNIPPVVVVFDPKMLSPDAEFPETTVLETCAVFDKFWLSVMDWLVDASPKMLPFIGGYYVPMKPGVNVGAFNGPAFFES